MVRFIHAADLHIDRSFEGLSSLQGRLPFEGVQMNQRVLTNIVDQALEHQVDFLLLVGDTFHQHRPSLQTQHHFIREMERLARAVIPVYLTFGNHDHYDPQRYWFAFPENVHVFTSEKVATFEGRTMEGDTYAISGFSYHRPHIPEEKVLEFPQRKPVAYHIGLFHGEQQGAHYAPFSVSQMQGKGYDYWALGHIHVPTILSRQPLIQYSGAPQGHTIKETQAGSVCLVELQKGQSVSRSVPVAMVLWQEAVVDLGGIYELNAALGKIRGLLPTADQPILVRLQINNADDLPNEFQQRAHSGELAHFLNDSLTTEGHQTRITELLVGAGHKEEKLFLPASEELLKQMLQEVAVPEVFGEIVGDLQGQPLLKEFSAAADFRQETLTRTENRLQATFEWGDGK